MSFEDEEYKKKHLLNTKLPPDEADDESGGEAGSEGSAGSAIAFVDFLSAGEGLREELLPDEIRRLLISHHDINKENVKKQKDKRDTYKNLKEGKQSLNQYRQGGEIGNDKPAHPILSNKAQFSGSIDNSVNPAADINNANTNEADRNELELRYSLQHRPENAPRFNPKPTPYN